METQPAKHSCIYDGYIRHRRFLPKANFFKYRLFMWYLDLDELGLVATQRWYFRLNKFGLVSFCRDDYFGDSSKDLKSEVQTRVSDYFLSNGLSKPSISSVRMLTHVRYLNIIFNPVSFYYCFDDNEDLVAILAEITNTPWGERHSYVLPCSDQLKTESVLTQQRGASNYQFEFDKKFHVSPFNPMEMQYDWRFNTPSQKLAVHMENLMCSATDPDAVDKHFDSTLGMSRKPLSEAGRILLKQPLMTVKVVIGIYWQACRLWVLKRVPFYDHPDLESESSNTESSAVYSSSGTLTGKHYD